MKKKPATPRARRSGNEYRRRVTGTAADVIARPREEISDFGMLAEMNRACDSWLRRRGLITEGFRHGSVPVESEEDRIARENGEPL